MIEKGRGILTNWKAVKAEAWRRCLLKLKERGRSRYLTRERRELRREREKRNKSGKKTSLATLVSRWAS